MAKNKKPDELTSGVSKSISGSEIKTEKKPKSKVRKSISVNHSPAYHIFAQSIQRSRNLLEIHKQAHGKQAKPGKYLSDVHRAAVVLAISALDGFISHFVSSKISAILASETVDIPSELLNKIKEAADKNKHTIIIQAVKKNDIRQQIESLLQEEYKHKTFQGTESIEDCMKIIGFKDIFKTIATKAKLNEDSLKEKLNQYTKRRHNIVHRGDFNTTENPPTTENSITKSYANDCIQLIETIAKHISEL